MDEAANELSKLSVDNNRLQEISDIFENRGEIALKEGDLDYLLKCSLKIESGEVLEKLLERDVVRFLELLRCVGDKQGGVLVNMLNLAKKDRAQRIEQIFKVIGRKLVNLADTDLQETKFYCGVYLGLKRAFDVSDVKRLDVLFGHVNCFSSSEDAGVREELNATISLMILTEYKENPKEVLERVQDYFNFQYDDETKLSYHEFGNMVKLMDILFPIMPEAMVPIYTSKKFTNHVLKYIMDISSSGLKYETHKKIAKCILSLISTSCLSDACRKYNTETYLKFLDIGSKHEMLDIRLLSVLDIIKLWNFVQINKDDSSKVDISELTDKIFEAIHGDEDKCKVIEYIVEGLAYLSLQPKVAKSMRVDETVISFLVSLLDNHVSKETYSEAYGLAVLFQNLTKIPETTNNRNRTINHLKEIADPSTVNGNQVSNKDEILLFNKYLLMEHKIIQRFIKRKSHSKSLALAEGSGVAGEVLLKMIHSIATIQEKATRAELVKQGAMNVIMDFLVTKSAIKEGYTRSYSESANVLEARLSGVRSLAKILISVNPTLVFNKYDQKSVASFLFEILGPSIKNYSGGLQDSETGFGSHLTNLDKFESLLALTNITSYESAELKDFVITKIFDSHIDDLIMEADVPDIQRTSWELVSNLITRPLILAKFFNTEEKDNKKRLQLMIKLLHANQESLQIVIGGLLATATSEYDLVSYILIDTPPINIELMDILAEIFEEQPSCDSLILRISYLFMNLVFAAANRSEKSLLLVKSQTKLIHAVEKISQGMAEGETKEILQESVKLIKST